VKKRCPQCGDESDQAFCARCGHTIGRDVLLGGAEIAGRYRIVKTLSSTEYGNVYAAVDIRLGGASCTIREYLLDYIDFSLRSEALLRFREETYRLSSLRHPGLPTVRDFFDESSRQYIVLEAVEGEPLQAVVEKAKREGRQLLECGRVISWAIEICSILEYLHNQAPPFVFRELRPAHIFMNEQEKRLTLMSMDADIRQFLHSGRSVTAMPGYAPREQLQGSPEPRSDIYALGKSMFFLLTAEEPNPFIKVRLSSVRSDLMEGLERVVEIATGEEPDRRFRTAADLREALSRLNVAAAPVTPHILKEDEKKELAKRHAEKALEYLQQHDIDSSIMECNKALLFCPDLMEAHLYLGHAYLKEGRAEMAVEKYRKAAALDPKSSKAHCNMALALYHMGFTEAAVEENQTALSLDPKNVVALNNLGSIYRETGRAGKAQQFYETALALDPRYTAAHYNLGLTFLELGRFDDSARESGLAIECDPDNVHAMINLGLAYYHQGKLDLFVECNHRVLALEPDNAKAYNNLGVIAYAEGDLEGALQAFKKALQCDSTMEYSLFNIKMIEDEQNEK